MYAQPDARGAPQPRCGASIEVLTPRKYRVMVNGHSHCRLVRVAGSLTIVNAGALCHPEDPGILRLDFEKNRLQWHGLRGSSLVATEEQPIV